MVGQPFHLGLGPWNHIGACWITLCGFFCAVVFFWAGSGGRTLHHRNGLGRWWRIVYQMELPPWLVNLFTWVWSHWNHGGVLLEALCVFLCSSGVSLGLDLVVGPLHHLEVLEGGWRSFFLYQNGTSSCLVHHFTWVWNPWNVLVPVGSLCVVSVQWCYLGLDLAVGPTPPPGTCLEGGGGPSCKWNYSGWSTFSLGSGVTGTILWCLLEHFVWFSVQWCSLGLDLVVGPLHHLERSWKVVEVILLPNGTIPHGWSTFSLGSGVPGTILVPVGALCVVFCVVWCS
jgi:hypothetical protein